MTKKILGYLAKEGIEVSDAISEIVDTAICIKSEDFPTLLGGKLQFRKFEENLVAAISVALSYCTEELLACIIDDCSIKDLHNFVYDTRNFLSNML